MHSHGARRTAHGTRNDAPGHDEPRTVNRTTHAARRTEHDCVVARPVYASNHAIASNTTSASSTISPILIQLHGRDPAIDPVTPLTTTW